MIDSSKNLAIYEQGRQVPVEAQKSFSNGKFSGTDINPMWRIKKLTELFGPAGIGWYTEIVHREIVESQDGTKCSFVGINLFVKWEGEWSKPIYGEGGNTFSSVNKYDKVVTSDEAYKMAYTDALSIAAKALGIGADIWFANDKQHSTKYDQKMEMQQDGKQSDERAVKLEQYRSAMTAAKTNDEVIAIWGGLTADEQADEEFKAICSTKCKELRNAA